MSSTNRSVPKSEKYLPIKQVFFKWIMLAIRGSQRYIFCESFCHSQTIWAVNMNILAIETSTKNCSVALYVDGKVTHHAQLAQREQAMLILPMIDQLFKAANISVEQLDYIALSVGPGSFTGLRLAMGVAQGFSLTHDIPVIAISSLAVWAQAAYRANPVEQITVAVNAHMGEVYVGHYLKKQKIMTNNKSDALIKLDEVSALISLKDWVSGDCWEAHADLPQPEHHQACLPDAEALLDLALANIDSALSINDVSLNYLRKKDAWKTVEQQKR
jgi:tRNA threonylcarbamoyladenosine biosynthesis protein TsaB